ncbi:MAG TPA: alpha/beta fold hydrolase, partial [Propionicimonas sp.]|nr:alpha/beta fold hydrolase [Propionicimonas sp.]
MSSQHETTSPRESTGSQTRERMLAGMPVTARQLQLAGVSTAVLEGGEGPPVVLLHGPGEFAALWARVIPDLVKTRRVVAPDLPGHGASGMPRGRLDRERVLAWLGELIEETCSAPPVLVGHLMGGAIAARFASDHGDRVDALVLVDTF